MQAPPSPFFHGAEGAAKQNKKGEGGGGGGVVEWISRRTDDHKVRGSNPVHSTNVLWQDINLQFARLDPSKVNGHR